MAIFLSKLKHDRKIKAKLILEDDSEFSGYSFGFGKNVNGKVACLGDDFN